MQILRRAFPVRLTLVFLAVAVVVFSTFAESYMGHGIPEAVLSTLLGLFAAAIAGDTFRPSGTVKAPPAGPGADVARLDALNRALQRARAVQAAGPDPLNREEPLRAVPTGGDAEAPT